MPSEKSIPGPSSSTSGTGARDNVARVSANRSDASASFRPERSTDDAEGQYTKWSQQLPSLDGLEQSRQTEAEQDVAPSEEHTASGQWTRLILETERQIGDVRAEHHKAAIEAHAFLQCIHVDESAPSSDINSQFKRQMKSLTLKDVSHSKAWMAMFRSNDLLDSAEKDLDWTSADMLRKHGSLESFRKLFNAIDDRITDVASCADKLESLKGVHQYYLARLSDAVSAKKKDCLETHTIPSTAGTRSDDNQGASWTGNGPILASVSIKSMEQVSQDLQNVSAKIPAGFLVFKKMIDDMVTLDSRDRLCRGVHQLHVRMSRAVADEACSASTMMPLIQDTRKILGEIVNLSPATCGTESVPETATGKGVSRFRSRL